MSDGFALHQPRFVANPACKTGVWSRESASQEGLGLKTLEALRSDNWYRRGKGVNLVRGLQKEIDDDPNAAPVLQLLKDRAERI